MASPPTQNPLGDPWKRTLYLMTAAQLITAIGFSSIFPFLPLYVKQLGSSRGFGVEFLSGLVFSVQAVTMMLASPVWGSLADRYGRKLMVQRSMYGGAVLLLLMAFVRSAEELIVLRAVQGLVTGTIAATNALVASVVPRQRTGFAMGMLQVGFGSGVALGPVIGGVVADAYGYAAAFYVTAGLLLVAGLLVTFGVREAHVPRQALPLESPPWLAGWKEILRAEGVAATYGLRFLTQLGRMMLVPIAPLFIEILLADSGSVNTFTGLVIGSASATATASAVFLGRLGDRAGHRKVFIGSVLAAAMLYFPQSLVQSAVHLLFLQAAVGVAIGGVLPSLSALLARYTVAGEEGAVYGLDNSISAGARAVAPLIGAAVATAFGLRLTFVASALILLIAAAGALWRLPRAVAADPAI